ncbi:MAG: hypothetical protein WCH21_10900 [Bacteroidota bacterium]
MQKELKDAIIKYVQENTNDFQLMNNTTKHFRNYVYGDDGEYLIGGQVVAQFINDFINLYK